MLEQLSINHFLSETTVEPGRWLFHYTSAEGCRAILETGNLRLNPLGRMNDPRERKEWVARKAVIAAGDMTLESLSQQDLVLSQPDVLLRRAARIGCFTAERSQMEDADPDSLFHRGWARARMWHQYAREHEGACLVFDQEALAKAFDDGTSLRDGDVLGFSPVRYRDRALDIPLAGSYATIDEIESAIFEVTSKGSDVADLFFTKNTDWQSESEVRALHLRWKPDPEADDEPLDLSYGDSLAAVVLGEEFENAAWLSALAEVRGIADADLVRADWVDGAPRLTALVD